MVRFYLGSSRDWRRTYASRKWVMSKKKKRSQALSDSSVEEKNHGNTMARLPGGRPIKVASPRVRVPSGGQVHRPLATGHGSIDHRSSSHRPIPQPTITGHGSPATVQMSITHEISSQSMTSHRPSCLRSLDLENLNTGENLYSPVTSQLATDHWSADLQLVKLMP